MYIPQTKKDQKIRMDDVNVEIIKKSSIKKSSEKIWRRKSMIKNHAFKK